MFHQNKLLNTLVIFCLLFIGCSGTIARTTSRVPEDSPSIAEQPTVRPAQPPESIPPESTEFTVQFACPDGWTPRPLSEDATMVMTHPSSAEISFMIWPLQQIGLRELLMNNWSEISDRIQQEGILAEISLPMSVPIRDGSEALVFTVVSDSRTTLFVVFESNLPGFGILVIGSWPASLDGEMMPVFQLVASSIRLESGESTEPEAGSGAESQPPSPTSPPASPELDRGE